MTEHRDDHGGPCARHPAVTVERLYELATVGSRVPGFHHDCASKLQSLMMALDEIIELADTGDAELRVAANTANTALRELHALLTANRALAKAPQRTRIAIGELMRTAGDRVGVRLAGALAGEVNVAVPAMTHALAMLLDLVAGPIHLGRAVDVALEHVERDLSIAISGPAEALAAAGPTANEAIAVATFVIERDGGQLHCKAAANAVVVRLPLSK